MEKWSVRYTEDFKPGPLTFWVHRETDGRPWYEATAFEPPLPKPVPGAGFAALYVQVFNVELHFASVPEVRHFLSVMRQKNLPTTRRLSTERGTSSGPNSHWLSRLPADLKAWRKREKIIKIIENALVEFEKVTKNF
jgi:hypothetical protein